MKQKCLCLFLTVILTSLIACTSTAPTPAAGPATKTTPSPAPTPQKVIELKISVETPPAHILSRSYQVMKADLESMSQGRLKVTVFGSETLAKATENYDAVVKGIADICHFSTGFAPGRFLLNDVFNLPGLWPNASFLRIAAKEVWNASPALQNEFKDVKYLGKNSSGPNRYMFVNRKVARIEDFKGLKIRGPGGISTYLANQLGSVPTFIAATEMYNAAKTGIIDVLYLPAAGAAGWKINEVAKYLLDMPLAHTGFEMVMNKNAWANLPPDLQALVQVAADKTALNIMLTYEAEDLSGAEYMARNGMEVISPSPALRESMQNAFKAVHKAWIAEMEAKKLPAGELYKLMMEVRQKVVFLFDK